MHICDNRTNLYTATFTLAKNNKPQCIAHRGYKAAWPENTIGAFKGAIEIGAHAIETDLHLSKDGVVVISHVCVDNPLLVLDTDPHRTRTSSGALAKMTRLSTVIGVISRHYGLRKLPMNICQD